MQESRFRVLLPLRADLPRIGPWIDVSRGRGREAVICTTTGSSRVSAKWVTGSTLRLRRLIFRVNIVRIGRAETGDLHQNRFGSRLPKMAYSTWFFVNASRWQHLERLFVENDLHTLTANEHIAPLAYFARGVASFASYSHALFGQNEIVAGCRETRRSWAKIAECHKGKRK